jgi:hypothetical protein
MGRSDLFLLWPGSFRNGDADFGCAALVVGTVAEFDGSAAGFDDRES